METQQIIQGRFDLATKEQIPHYFWPVPEWKDNDENFRLPDNVQDEPKISPKSLNCDLQLGDRIEVLRARYPDKLQKVVAERETETEGNPEQGDLLEKIPHDKSDCRHVDPGAFGSDRGQAEKERRRYRMAIKEMETCLEGGAGHDGELKRMAGRALAPLMEAFDLLDDVPKGNPKAAPKGMQRLRLIFEWMLCQVTTLFGEINAALDDENKDRGRTEYNKARDRYLALLRALDDSEPDIKPPPSAGSNKVPPRFPGYGRVIKWSYILPLIHDGKIKAAKVVAKWNPHISSAGVPIPHA